MPDGKESALREVIEDTLDWVAGLCGLDVPPRAPRSLRAAVRALGSAHLSERLQAESDLCADRHHAAPLLRQAAYARQPATTAVRAAVLLHKLQEQDGAEMLHHMAREHALHPGESSDLVRHAVRDIVGPEHYLQQASAAITLLEQRPESFRAIVRFRQAAQMLRFLECPLPLDVLRRALVVRTVGGEDLALVRAVLKEDPDVALEHVCMVRREAVLSLIRCPEIIRGGPAHRRSHLKPLQLLTHNLRHPSVAVKLTAIYGLEILGDPAAIAGVLPLAQDAASPLRDDARRLIDRLTSGHPDALTLLRAATPEAEDPTTLLHPLGFPVEGSPETLLRPDSRT